MAIRELRVFVYRNLNNRMFSVRDLATGRVIAHSPSVVLRDATFQVSLAGRARCSAEGCRNVHAGVRGTLVLDPFEMGLLNRKRGLMEAYYSPYKGPAHFADKDGNRVDSAPVVLLAEGKAFVPREKGARQ